MKYLLTTAGYTFPVPLDAEHPRELAVQFFMALPRNIDIGLVRHLSTRVETLKTPNGKRVRCQVVVYGTPQEDRSLEVTEYKGQTYVRD